jgi:hypothetical protein
MNTSWVLLVLLLVATLSMSDWRTGVLTSVVIGFVQDPLRKMLPGEPVYVTVLVAIALGVACLAARGANAPLRLRALPGWTTYVRDAAAAFALWVVIEAVRTVVQTGNAVVAGIGLLAYFMPVPALLIGYALAQSQRSVTRLITLYIGLTLVMTSGIFFSYVGYDWPILRSVGVGLYVYTTHGRLNLYSGFLRAPEVAAWHAAAAMCLMFVLFHARERRGWFAVGAITAFLIVATIMTGRRKFLVEPLLFISTYVVMLTAFRRGARELVVALLLLGIGGVLTYQNVFPDEWDSGLSPYYERLTRVSGEAVGRTYDLGLMSLPFVVAQNGVLGSGTGTGSQGSQHFGAGSTVVGVAAEGGLGKVAAELGLPGLALLLWLVVGIVRAAWGVISAIPPRDVWKTRFAFGIVAFLFANMLVFVEAHQIFGDVFVLVMLGLFVGFLFAVPGMRLDEARTMPVARFNARTVRVRGSIRPALR